MFHQPTVVDLFCGAGGLSLGFKYAGYDIAYGIDKDDVFLRTWENNHAGSTKNIDLSRIKPVKLNRLLSDNIDVVVGGPPCKDFSTRNRTANFRRNHLVTVFAEHVNEINPVAFVIENVRSLITRYDNIRDSVLDILDDYAVSYRLLDAADYGVPQHRIRAFIIGVKPSYLYDDEPKFPKPTHGPDSNTDDQLLTAGEALKDVNNPTDKQEYSINSKHAHLLEDIPEGMNYSFYTEKMGHPDPKFEWRSRFSDFLYKADPKKPVRTITAKPGSASGPFHWNNRKFTEQELKKLQGFPDNFSFETESYTKIREMIGNSVPPKMANAIAFSLLQQIKIPSDTISKSESLNFYARKRTSSEEYKKKAKNKIEKLYK